MMSDVLYPILISVGCLLIAFLVHIATKPKPTRDDITLPIFCSPQSEKKKNNQREPLKELRVWHLNYESTLLDFFDKHDREVAAPDLAVRTQTFSGSGENLTSEFEKAMDSHPTPEMRAELAALRTAADSLRLAHTRDDSEAISRHQNIYTQYRSRWLERLCQFPGNQTRVKAIRQRKMPH